MSDLSFSLREEPLLPPMISLISRLFWERVNRSVGFSARGSKGQTPRSGSLLRAVVAAATTVPFGTGEPLMAAVPLVAGALASDVGSGLLAGASAGWAGWDGEGVIFAADGIITAIFVGIT